MRRGAAPMHSIQRMFWPRGKHTHCGTALHQHARSLTLHSLPLWTENVALHPCMHPACVGCSASPCFSCQGLQAACANAFTKKIPHQELRLQKHSSHLCHAPPPLLTSRGTEAWRHGGTEAWRHGGMEVWKQGGMKAWKHRGTEAWRHGGMEAQRHEDPS